MNKFVSIAFAVAALLAGNSANAQTYSVSPSGSSGTISGTVDFSQVLPRATCTLGSGLTYSIGTAASSRTASTTVAVGTSLCTGFLSLVKFNGNWNIRATGANTVAIDNVWVDTIWPGTCGPGTLTGTLTAGAPGYIDLDPVTISGSPSPCVIYGGRIYLSGPVSITNP